MPLNWHVAFTGFGLKQNFFRFFYSSQDGRSALLVFINSNRQIDFVGTRIASKCVTKSENGIGRCNRKKFEHRSVEILSESEGGFAAFCLTGAAA